MIELTSIETRSAARGPGRHRDERRRRSRPGAGSLSCGVGFDRDVLHPVEPLNGLQPRYGLLDDQGLDDPVLVALYRIVVVGCEYSEATVDLSAETAGELQRQKLVQRRHASGVLDPSDDVRFSLMLDDEPC